MNQKAAYAFRIILSGYLAYLGVKIILEMVNEKPSNMVFMIVIGAAFFVIGAGYAIYCIKKVWEIRQADQNLKTDEPGEGKAEAEEADTADPEEKEELENDYEEK